MVQLCVLECIALIVSFVAAHQCSRLAGYETDPVPTVRRGQLAPPQPVGSLREQFLSRRCLHKHSGFDRVQRFIGRFGGESSLPERRRALNSATRASIGRAVDSLPRA